jgi:predicted aspartyl protease
VTVPFDPNHDLILVDAELEGPSGTVGLVLALDTGAAVTVIGEGFLAAVGYPPTGQPVSLVSASGQVTVNLTTVTRLRALGQEQTQLSVLAHTLPAAAGADGVLGLDFFRGLTLTIDFRQGLLTPA